ncbi:MAG: hypothetical protein QOF35_211 [Actinomycetota bacterium]|jgi:hypothetical protein|nr:hypothetical protein [Actinomycetota bacterium]
MGGRWVVRIAFVSFLVGQLLFSFHSYLVITAGGVNAGVLPAQLFPRGDGR